MREPSGIAVARCRFDFPDGSLTLRLDLVQRTTSPSHPLFLYSTYPPRAFRRSSATALQMSGHWASSQRGLSANRDALSSIANFPPIDSSPSARKPFIPQPRAKTITMFAPAKVVKHLPRLALTARRRKVLPRVSIFLSHVPPSSSHVDYVDCYTCRCDDPRASTPARAPENNFYEDVPHSLGVDGASRSVRLLANRDETYREHGRQANISVQLPPRLLCDDGGRQRNRSNRSHSCAK